VCAGRYTRKKKVNVGVPILMHCSRRIDKTGRKPAMDLYILLKNHKVERKKETKKQNKKNTSIRAIDERLPHYRMEESEKITIFVFIL
jgi:hypothetical protein